MTTRQAHLAKIFSEEGGAMGLYAEAFIDYVLSTPDFMNMIKEHLEKPLEYKRIPSSFLKNKVDSELRPDFPSKKSIPTLKRAWKVGLHQSSSDSLSSQINKVLRDILIRLKNDFFEINENGNFGQYKVKNSACPMHQHQKLSDDDFLHFAQPLYAKGNAFIMSPNIIIKEALDTMSQSIRWLCMWSKNEKEFALQMQAMFAPTVKHPKTGEMITPIHMLGLGNNGYIGIAINIDFPTHIGFKPTIRQAKTSDSAIINPKFADLWLNRKLDVGGCPALVHRRRTNDVFTRFARMYVECAEKVLAHSESLKAQHDAAPEETSMETRLLGT